MGHRGSLSLGGIGAGLPKRRYRRRPHHWRCNDAHVSTFRLQRCTRNPISCAPVHMWTRLSMATWDNASETRVFCHSDHLHVGIGGDRTTGVATTHTFQRFVYNDAHEIRFPVRRCTCGPDCRRQPGQTPRKRHVVCHSHRLNVGYRTRLDRWSCNDAHVSAFRLQRCTRNPISCAPVHMWTRSLFHTRVSPDRAERSGVYGRRSPFATIVAVWKGLSVCLHRCRRRSGCWPFW